jgi:transcriptional regulator with PAS, ATPase and Fis domain
MTTNVNEIKQQIKLLYAAGMQKQAIQLESSIRQQGHVNIGSVVAELELEKFITQDPATVKLKETVNLLAPLDEPCLILGETGTGKSIIAKALHGSREGKFIQINCTALTDELIASELFGHIKGSFTGALTDKIGKLQFASGGTIFLDEIGDMPLSMQTKLLKAIEEKVITPVGSNEEIKINCRIVAATNKLDIKAYIREDLYWRLSVFTLCINPLHERGSDPALIAKSIDPSFPFEQWYVMKGHGYRYAGNVREIRQAIVRYKYLGEL